MNRIRAPFTPEGVERLNSFQRSGFIHPFTCPMDHSQSRDLIATADGWICPGCDYTQDWCHAFMVGQMFESLTDPIFPGKIKP